MTAAVLPNTLVIGAMKAGTTSLWADLRRTDAVFAPANKEPGHLAHDEVLSASGGDSYASNFKGADTSRPVIDFSTDLAKFPLLSGSPQRARKVLGSEIKIVYMTREPKSRLRSHHGHLARLGMMPERLSEAIQVADELVDCSRYAHQLDQWTEEFPREQIFVDSIENYLSDRCGFFDRLGSFLDVDLAAVAELPAAAANTAAVGPRGRIGRSIVTHQFYRAKISDKVPTKAKSMARAALSRRAGQIDLGTWESVPADRRAVIERAFELDTARMSLEWGHDVG